MERDEDMSITGHRHAFIAKYKAGATNDGHLKFLEVELWTNAGLSMDLSAAVMDRALFHLDNAYKWPALKCLGHICKTNQPSHTAFRGFGAPQGMMICETAIDHLALMVKMNVDKMRELNIYREGDRTHYGQLMDHYFISRAYEEVKSSLNIDETRKKIDDFNAKNRWRKRGLCVLPTKFGINFTVKFMNQGGALVHIYTDGTILVSHGGTEMGQGLNTKVIQIAARSFGISDTQVHIAETATDKVPNSSPTAASMSTDLYGMATLNACEQIKERLRPIAEKMPGADFRSIIQAAYFERVNLSAQGFYVLAENRCGYDWDINVKDNSLRGQPFNYYTTGLAVTEVEIDCLTGDFNVLRTDVVMEIGNSINHALDIGQIEGALIQGMGWCTTEELIWGDSDHKWVPPGVLFTKGPGTYKIPSFNDIPTMLNVKLLPNTNNPFAVHSSKAVGEPPFYLGTAVFWAIKGAIQAARKDTGHDGYFHLDLPATSERIRLGCVDSIITSENIVVKGSF